jgi:hypothetical protein
MCTPDLRHIVHKHQVEPFRSLRKLAMGGIRPQFAGSVIGNDETESAHKFVGVLLAVCTRGNSLNPGSSRITFVIVENFLKAFRYLDWR